MVITVNLNPAMDRTVTVAGFTVDGVNRVLSSRVDAGGKGINVAKTIKVLGGEPMATGIVGGSAGRFIQQQLDEMGIRHDFVLSEHPTRTNTKISDSLRHTTTELNEAGAPVTKELLQHVWEKIDAAAKPGDTVVFAGANPPGMEDDMLAEMIKTLRQKGVFTALDTVGEAMRLGIKAKPTVIKPNQSELSEILGEELHYVRDIIAAGRQILRDGIERVIVSMGAEGALFMTEDAVLRGYGLKIPLGSTVGSGDAMMAAILHFSEQGCQWEQTVRWSIATSAANAMCQGSQTPSMETIEELEKQVVVERLM